LFLRCWRILPLGSLFFNGGLILHKDFRTTCQ
jgi:hypothetical protein